VITAKLKITPIIGSNVNYNFSFHFRTVRTCTHCRHGAPKTVPRMSSVQATAVRNWAILFHQEAALNDLEPQKDGF